MRRRLELLVCMVTGCLVVAAGAPVEGASSAAASVRAAGIAVRPWTNLLENAGAEAGDASVGGWDAVTIPGWRTVHGLPTVVRYGTAGFPSPSGAGPPARGRQLFAGGAGGTAVLTERVAIRAAGGPLRGARFSLSGWLGAPRTGFVRLGIRFESRGGSTLGTSLVTARTKTLRGDVQGLAHRTVTGVLPAGATSAEVALVLGTNLRDYDGPNSPIVGYNRAAADNVSLSLSVPVMAPHPLAPPAAHVPRFRHVFLVYMENEDYGSVVGNTAEAPFFNNLRRRGSLLSNLYAEEHPSDGNYLALAAGGVFGLPLTDPLEINPHYTVNARNIGDLVTSAHETWRGYLQSANGPCDDTVHRYYWNDDLPMLYFKDVRERPSYCAHHLVPLSQLGSDLRRAGTTPDLAWIGPNDCSDMEGCGIRAGDAFLAGTLRTIFASPAWTSQPSLLIVTFDEDGYDFQHPAQHVATVVVGSRFVKHGYVSTRRYTHYSLLRTIEAGLGLGTLTDNDRYAGALNDVFTGGAGRGSGGEAAALAVPGGPHWPPAPRSATRATPPSFGPSSQTAVPGRQPAGPPGPLTLSESPSPPGSAPVAYVVNSSSGTVTPVDLGRRRVGTAIAVGRDPVAVALARDKTTAYVVNHGSNSVTPIDTATNRPGKPIPVGKGPCAIAISPDGSTAYVVDTASDAVTPINTATGRPEAPIPVGDGPVAIAIAPDGRTAYVVDQMAGAVTPIKTANNIPGRPIRVGSYPSVVAITPDGTTAFVASYGSDTVTPIHLATERAGAAIKVGGAPDALAITADGATALVADGNSEAVTPISTSSLRAGAPIRVGLAPTAIAVDPAGAVAYVTNTISGSVTPIDTKTLRAGAAVNVGKYSYPTAVAFAPGGSVALVLGTYNGTAVEVVAAARRAVAWFKVGAYPGAVALS